MSNVAGAQHERPCVLLVGALDTKGPEFEFLRSEGLRLGCDVLLLDVGVLGAPAVLADFPREAVADAAGAELGALVSTGDRSVAVSAMARGAARLAAALADEGRIDGVIGAGGSNAAYVMARVSERLDVGFPKVLVSTMASGDTARYVGSTDLTMMNSVVDVNGLNRVTRSVLGNAIHAVVGMVTSRVPDDGTDRPVAAISMFGVTTPCASRIASTLDAAGLEPLSFHANGAGGRSLEALAGSGAIQVVVDMTTTELADELFGGVCSAGPDRLTAAGRLGVPQVVSLGALDMINFGAAAALPEHLRGRLWHEHNPEVTLVRTNAEECAELGGVLAARLNAALGPRTVVVPARGFSALSVPGEPFQDPHADRALVDALLGALDDDVTSVVLDVDINDPLVADAMSRATLSLMEEARV
ncbi:protein of unknown function UPF0261 [Beutenbergia cavernae DSM 12333]|uniref:Uncharacterized protein n=1 Tax=Beutenbergia cavernae (strain ATCC BAA-8 / DSM 12333 / CCUG 43141 / JCM 11478 / NBRC 16432 / NCIMB 13614 / HKI 0122) TaxID=471853 RepID=C5C4B5_BEUC1|nr:Tm-1-like ATP-binding domain-containing protein [Beutenbergia cavernae]ACQ82039.1 protein of unknown function UPF0261 [Beutenbergia cavernae DSM 12333]